ncbi:MAG TPA: hypothetical protein VFI31_07575 [Pirellulales bacterium]|nr:hypothetical protein [Pirellulales bacterium]
MSTIEVSPVTKVADIEQGIRALGIVGQPELRLPERIERSAFGGEAALIQYIVTWARRFQSGRLLTDIPASAAAPGHSDPPAEATRLCRWPYGFAAALMASDVIANDGKTSVRNVTNRECGRVVDGMSRSLREASYGHRTFLACVEPSTKANLPAFYWPDGTVRNRSEFRSLVNRLLDCKAGQFVGEQFDSTIVEGLGNILFELFKNTHDWSRTDLTGAPFARSLRGLLMTRFNMPLAAARRAAANGWPLERYVSGLKGAEDAAFVRILELSVFDSGPGLACRWLGSPLSEVTIEQEHEACLACLRKHQSSSASAHRGLGLHDVMKTLSPLRAFVRIRTGRLTLYRDFIQNPLGANEAATGPILFDWSRGREAVTQFAPAAGLLYTILIPLAAQGAR